MGYYLGIVGTARISKIALANENAEIIKAISAPPLTIRVDPNIRNNLERSFQRLVEEVGISYEELTANMVCSCIAMSGVYSDRDRNTLRQILDDIGFCGFNRVMCEDANAHLASNFIASGGLVIAGTGANVFFRSKESNSIIRVDGWGSDIGDDGGGYDLGRECLRLLFRTVDHREEKCDLLKKNVLEYVGLPEINDLIQWFYNARATEYWRSYIAGLAIPLVETAMSEKGRNSQARKLVYYGVRKLFKSFLTAFNEIKHSNFVLQQPCTLILEGGLFDNCEIYYNYFLKKINALTSSDFQFRVVRPEFNQVVGALALAISGSDYVDCSNKKIDLLKKSARDSKLILNYNQTWGRVI